MVQASELTNSAQAPGLKAVGFSPWWRGGGAGAGQNLNSLYRSACIYSSCFSSFKNHMESQVLTAISLGEYVLQLVPGHEGLQECRKCRNAGGGQTKQSL